MRHLHGKADRYLLKKEPTTWFLHSTYQRTFNLTNENKSALVLVAPMNYPRLPGGIYLPVPVFEEVFAEIKQLQQVTLSENQLVFVWNQKTVTLLLESTFDSSLKTMVDVLPNECLFLQKIQKNRQMTGFDQPLSHFSQAERLPFRPEIEGLFSLNQTKKQKSLTYFLGRGRGLTPSGDDFLLGWLFVQQLIGKARPNERLIEEKAQSPYYTTDVSRHYLRQAAASHYSQALLDLGDALTKEQINEQTMNRAIAEILAHGHSSGADTLAGIAATLIELRRKKEMAQRVVIALGGNAILRPGQEATVEVQMENIKTSAEQIAKIEALNYEVVLTHGNGPQVGNILQQNELAKEVVPPFPLDVCNAESQGFIGYMLEQSIKNRLYTTDSTADVVTMLTQIEVDKNDPAFDNPTKPIGVFYTEEEAKVLEAEKGWVMMEDAGRGYRRAVASPLPERIHGVDAITHLVTKNMVVIAGGGGGIPVYRDENGQLVGLEAVIDKDRTGKKLAEQVDADAFMMLTDVPNVYINWGQPNQQKLEEISVEEAQRYMDEGHFAAGSMGPKMGAAIDFALGGRIAIICALDEADLALQGKAGTRIVG